MSSEKTPETLLAEAIHRFNTTSTELEKSYALLSDQVRQLKEELEIKNKALDESALEQERLREQAHRNDRLAAVGEMAARMAHELRNPLGSIELFVSLLARDTTDSDKKKWLEHIKTAVDAMDYAISNLLFFTGKPKPHFKTTDLTEVIDEASHFTTHLLQQKEISLVISLDRLQHPIACDEDLLRQVFVNLIQNAVDALPKGGQLTINGFEEEIEIRTPEGPKHEPGIVVTVTDNGCGIPKDQLSKIFDPFYTTKNKGTGLGLAIVHNAIAAHKGTIEVSEVENGGTCFTVRIPRKS